MDEVHAGLQMRAGKGHQTYLETRRLVLVKRNDT
jgi:hypothetical protein